MNPRNLCAEFPRQYSNKIHVLCHRLDFYPTTPFCPHYPLILLSLSHCPSFHYPSSPLSLHCPLFLQSSVLPPLSIVLQYLSIILPLSPLSGIVPIYYYPIILLYLLYIVPTSIYTVASSLQLPSWKSSDLPCLILVDVCPTFCELML